MTQHVLKLLIIENNPLVGEEKRASDLVKMTDKIRPSVEELMDDIAYSSHGLVRCEIAAWEREDDFALHKCTFTRKNGTKANTLDGETLTELYKNGWYGWWNSEWFGKEVLPPENGHSFSYDYDAMIRAHDIVSRRNKGEFDMILLVNIDPVYCYEAAMIGRSAYWINGEPMEYDCPMTAIMNVSVSRRDANFECFGHMMEMIMGHVFCDSTDMSGYREGEYNDMDVSKMSLWTRFVLCDRNFNGVTGCGNVHFSPNSVVDYDWRNEKPTLSTWRDWLENYPNLTGEAEVTDCRAYFPVGAADRDACRLHHRWWFSAMPHVAGVTSDGYSNSWWDYFCALDYVTAIDAPESVTVSSFGEVSGTFFLRYRSGKVEQVTLDDARIAVHCAGSVALCRDGKIHAGREGEGTVSVFRDGVEGRMTVKIQ